MLPSMPESTTPRIGDTTPAEAVVRTERAAAETETSAVAPSWLPAEARAEWRAIWRSEVAGIWMPKADSDAIGSARSHADDGACRCPKRDRPAGAPDRS